jgi:hypothetical protein
LILNDVVVGIGLDLTSSIIENVSKTAGCNYANVRSTSNFKEIMDKGKKNINFGL